MDGRVWGEGWGISWELCSGVNRLDLLGWIGLACLCLGLIPSIHCPQGHGLHSRLWCRRVELTRSRSGLLEASGLMEVLLSVPRQTSGHSHAKQCACRMPERHV